MTSFSLEEWQSRRKSLTMFVIDTLHKWHLLNIEVRNTLYMMFFKFMISFTEGSFWKTYLVSSVILNLNTVAQGSKYETSWNFCFYTKVSIYKQHEGESSFSGVKITVQFDSHGLFTVRFRTSILWKRWLFAWLCDWLGCSIFEYMQVLMTLRVIN